MEKIQNTIDSFGLRKFVRIPLKLSIVIQILPDLLKHSETTKSGDQNMSQFRLYQLFTSRVMRDTANRFVASQKDQNEEHKQHEEKVGDLFEKLNTQLQSLALGLSGYPFSPGAEAKGREETNGLFKRCPLLRVDDTHADCLYAFAHESYQVFFFAAEIIKEILNLPKDQEKIILNQKLLKGDAFSISVLHFLVDAVKDQIISTSSLIELIQESKITATEEEKEANKIEIEPQFLMREIPHSHESAFQSSVQHSQHHFSVAAANAISILNTAGYDFSHQNLSDVCIAGANLSYGLFEGTNFSRADLQGVNFSGAWLKDTNFEYANMDRVQFGMIPNITLDDRGMCIAHSPVSNHLVIGSLGEIIVLKKCADKFTEEKRLKGHVGYVYSCSFSGDGKYLVSGGEGGDRTVRIWDFERGECIKILEGHGDGVIKCKFSADGKQIVSLDEGQIMKKWDLSAGGWTLSFELNGVRDCEFIPGDERIICVWSSCTEPALHDSRTGKYIIGKFEIGSNGNNNKGSFSSDGKQIVFEMLDRPIDVYDTLRRHLTNFYERSQYDLYNLGPAPSFTSYDSQILSVNGTVVRIQDVTTGKYEDKALDDKIWSYSIDPAHQRQIVVGLAYTTIVFLENEMSQQKLSGKNATRGINQKGFNVAGANIDSTKGLTVDSIRIFDEVGDYKGFGVENLKELILNNQISILENITKIDLSDRDLGSQGAKIIGRNVKWINLMKIDLSKNNISEEGAIALTKNNTWKELQELLLNSNKISDKGLIAISENTCWKNLRKLQLESNSIGNLGAKSIGENSVWKKLEELDLSQNDIGEEGAIAIGRNATWTFLMKLDLSSNKIGDEGAKAIARNETWICLEELNLADNKIGDLGVTEIGRNISWKNLKALSLESNAFSDTGAKVIVENKAWAKLEKLYLYCNSLSEEFTDKIEKNLIWSNMKVLICKIQNSRLQELMRNNKLLGVNLSVEDLGDNDATIIGRMSTAWKNVIRLWLAKNGIGGRGATAIGANTAWSKLRALSLASNRIGDEGAVSIGSNTTWKNLDQLCLDENEIGDLGATAIGANTTWSQLKWLLLDSNRIGDEGSVSIGSNTTWKNLEKLCLYENKIGDLGAAAIGANTTWNRLKELRLNSNRIGDEGTISIGSNITWINLEQLYLQTNEIGNKGAAAIGANTTWSKLKILELGNNKIGNEGAVSIGSNTTWKNLDSLNLWGNEIGDKGAAAIGANITWSKLKVLTFHSNRIGDEGAVSIGSNTTWKNLKMLTLGRNNISDKGAIIIGSNHIWNNLEILTLSENQIGDQGAVLIANNVTWCKLKNLSLNTNKIGDHGVLALSKNTVWVELVELKIYNNPFNNKSLLYQAFSGETWKNLKTFIPFVTLALQDFLDSIKNQKSVNEVNLCSKALTDEDAIILASTHPQTLPQTLEILVLSQNNIGDKGGSVIGASNVLWNLKKLDLSGNKISDVGAEAIGKNYALHRLQELNLAHNQIGDQGMISIEADSSFRNLIKLDLSANRIGDKGARFLGLDVKWSYLEELYLQENEIGDQGAHAIGRNKAWKKLVKFEIHSNKYITEIGEEELKKNLIFGQFVIV